VDILIPDECNGPRGGGCTGPLAGTARSHRNTDSSGSRRDVVAHTLVLIVAVSVAWSPVETRPLMAVVVAGVVLALCTWGWSRGDRTTFEDLAGGAVVLVVLVCSAGSGWDPSRAVGEIGLIMAVSALAWLGSRSLPPNRLLLLFALGLSGLAVWGIWQVATGLDALRPGLEVLPDATRIYAEERVASHRAFASLPLPSHLAVLLAMVLPLLVTRVRATPAGAIAALGAALSVVGLLATQSPVGVVLGFGAVVALVIGRHRRLALVVTVLLAVVMVAVLAVRPDVARLEPVALRVDNWRTALWLSTTSPASGVGLSSFAQASQGIPIEVGNRPAHAHNLPLEFLAELGPTGLVGCLVLGFWLARLIVLLWPRDRALAVALAVVPLHNLVDFSFFVSGVALPWAALLGWGISRSRPSAEVSEPSRGRIVLVIGASVAIAMTTLHATSVVVEENAAAHLESVDRFEGALRSLRLAPWRVEPQFLLAAAALEVENPSLVDLALNEMDARRWVRPRSAALAERRAWLALHRGDVSSAICELWAAVEYGSPEPKREHALRELLARLSLAALEGEAHGPPG